MKLWHRLHRRTRIALAAGVVVLAVEIGVYLLLTKTIPELLALAVIVVTPLFWAAGRIMWSRHRKRPDLRLLRVAAEASVASAVYVTILALVFLNNGMAVPILDPFATMVIGRTALLVLLAIPVVRFLWVTRGMR